MRYLFLLLFLVSCATLPPCPPQDVYFLVMDDESIPRIIEMDEGFIDARGNWKSEDEMIEWQRQRNVVEGEMADE